MENTTNPRTVERKRIAAEFLTRAADDLARATIQRVRYVKLARDYGMTNADIGTFLGVSEAAVRTLVKRNPDVTGGDE